MRIPNKELVVPELTIDEETGAINSNSSTKELLLNSIQRGNVNDLAQLGRQFLSIVYLMLNQDANSFTLWEAATSTGPEDLVAVDQKNERIGSFCASKAGDSPNSSSSSSADDAGSTSGNDNDNESTFSTGAIVGVVIGGVAGAGIIAAIVVFIMARKRKMRRRLQQSSGEQYNEPVYMYHQRQPPKELEANPKTWDPFELPGESPGKRHLRIPELP